MPKINIKFLNNFLIVAVFIGLISGCAATQKKRPDIQLTNENVSTINNLIDKANTEKEPYKSRHWLEVGQILTKGYDYENAVLAFTKIDPNYLNQQQIWQMLDSATDATLGIDDAWQSLEYINLLSPRLGKLSSQNYTKLLLKQAIAYEKVGKHEESARAFYLASTKASYSQKADIEKTLWQNLVLIDKDRITSLARYEKNTNLRAWFELAQIRQDATVSLPALRSKLNTWLRKWPQHSAAKNLPEDMRLLKELSENPIKKFAFYLPLSGKYASIGNSIKDGFLAVYYNKSSYERKSIKLNFYDSEKISIWQMYDLAKEAGSEVVIGPFDKDSIEKTSKYSSLPLPTLALNYSTNAIRANNLIQFGLAAENEAEQAAQYAWKNGLRKALIIVVADSWGQRVRKAFIDKWQELGGQIIETSFIGKNSNIASSMEDLLEVTSSKNRRRQLVNDIYTKVEFEPSIRGDADFIFLHTDNSKAKLVIPALKFLKAQSLPVIATSAVYQVPDQADRDLDSMIFCDLPWYLNNKDRNKLQIAQLWQKEFKFLGRIYALGVDSYKIAELLPLLQAIPETNIQGVTGVLSQKDGKIFRGLPWAKFVNGYPQLINAENLKKQNQ